MIYTVKNLVVENTDLVYNEGVTRVFLYTDGELGGTDEVRALLKYFTSTNEANAVDSELRSIQSIIDDVKGNREVGERHMTLEEYCNHKIEHGIRVGIEEAVEKAVEEAVEKAVEEAVEKAVEEAIEEAVEEALDEAKRKDILNLIKFLKSNKTSDEQIVSALMEVHSLTKEEAETWLQNN